MKPLFLCAALVAATNHWKLPEDHQLSDEIFHRATGGSDEEKMVFDAVINHFLKEFPLDTYASFLETFSSGVKSYQKSDAYLSPTSPKCEKRSVKLVANGTKIKGKKTFPGGIVSRLFGFDIGKLAFELLEKSTGAAGMAGIPVQMLASTALTQAVGLIQTIISDALIIIPPMIPPPIWINQPLPCLPMLTGHNCFGAVLYPITLADFVIADVTDASVNGYIANFPKLFYAKVGTVEELYLPCFSAYMSMHCASIFPICTTIFARDEQVPGIGRAPMCFYHCILTLVMCPGFWIEDIIGACTDLGLPPMCSTALFWRLDLAPPQYVSQEDSQARPASCPKQYYDGIDGASDPHLYTGLEAAEPSPILETVEASKLPPSRAKSFLKRVKSKK